MLRNKSLSEKVMVLGIDGLDPRYTKKMVDAGKMPNFKKLIEAGAQREDLEMLGGCAPVTPPGWATLGTGAYSYTHSVTQFFAKDPKMLDMSGYNIHSRMCLAEPVWNAIAENGLNTCVFHWPGGAWPPTSDSEHLFMIDGTVPGAPGMACYMVDPEFFFGASPNVETLEYMPAMEGDSAAPCVIEKLPDEKRSADDKSDISGAGKDGYNKQFVYATQDQGWGITRGGFRQLFNFGKSYLRPANGWVNAPEDALEFGLLTSKGLIRRVGLVLKNAEGNYDTIQIYKTKKDVEPMVTLKEGQYYRDFVDDGYQGDRKCVCSRDIYVQEIKADGTSIRMFFTSCAAIDNDSNIHPNWLHNELMANVGPYPPTCQFYKPTDELHKIQMLGWEHVADWYIKAIDYLIAKHDMKVIFSHWHGCDLMVHTFIRYMKDQGWNEGYATEDHVEEWMEQVYELCDRYIGAFVHYLDEDWTIMVTSDHALVCPANEPPAVGDMSGINVALMEELGYTVLKVDENGNKLKEIDWTKTTAIQEQGGNVWINLKSRWENGIVEDEDQYMLEEKIMTDLMGYKHPKTGMRCIAVALRKKDAKFFGYGGPQAGDIFIATAEGYNYDHTDGLATAYGERGTSLSPIYIGAGKGLKKGYTTNRVIRQVDLAPTVCVLTGSRIPDTCDGAPMYDCLVEGV